MAHPLELLKDLGCEPRGLIHVGAHIGQEFEDYKRHRLEQVLYIEANPRIYEQLKRRVESATGHFAINALCAERDGCQVKFRVSSNEGLSSSILDFGWHATEHPEVHWASEIELTTTTLDKVIDRFCAARPRFPATRFDCVVLDTQGTELRVFQGAHRSLSIAQFVYTEVNEGGLYEADASLEDVTAFMKTFGFRLKNLHINRHRWGDALFVKGA